MFIGGITLTGLLEIKNLRILLEFGSAVALLKNTSACANFTLSKFWNTQCCRLKWISGQMVQLSLISHIVLATNQTRMKLIIWAWKFQVKMISDWNPLIFVWLYTVHNYSNQKYKLIIMSAPIILLNKFQAKRTVCK